MKILENIPENYKVIIDKITKVAKENNFIIYAVGGFVRDIFLKRIPNDLDIMVEGNNGGIKFSKLIAEKLNLHQPVIFERFATSKLIIDGQEIEFIMPRKEYYETNSRNPDTEIGSLEQDALRRDFTVNALFLRLNDLQLLDLTGKGLLDIQDKIIRVTDESSADVIFSQDPLRILRAIRQSFQLKFSIEPKTYASMKNNVDRITIVSGERIRDEINKMLLTDTPSKAFLMLDDIGLLNIILPELKQTQNVEQPAKYHDKDVFYHTLEVIDKVKPYLLLRVAALLHDIAKPQTKTVTDGKISFIGHEKQGAEIAKNILSRLKYPADFIKQVCFLIENHLYPKMYLSSWKDTSIRKFADKIGNCLEYIKLLNMADSKKFDGELFDRVSKLKRNNMLMPEADLFNGNELIKMFDQPAGQWITEVKNYIRELQFENPKITKEQVIERLEDWIIKRLEEKMKQ